MSSEIYLVGRGKVNEGRIEAAKAAVGDVIQHVRASNPGVLVYEHAIEPKAGTWTGIEKYANSEALKAHLMDPAVGEGLGRFMEDLAFEGIVVIGQVSNEVQEMMAAFNPTYLGNSSGFSRAVDREVVGPTS